MRIAVLGAGGVGGYFGGRLARAGHDVTFVARGAHLAALREQGLAVESVAGDFVVAPVTATDDTSGVGAVDVVVLCVKTWQLPAAIEALPPLVGRGTGVVTLQNGVEAPVEVAEAVGREAVLPGVARIFAAVDGPGRVRHVGGPASLAFAEWDNRDSARLDGLRAALGEAGVAVETPGDIWTELWAKFLFVVPLGGLGGVTGAPVGVLRSRAGTRRLLVEAMTEIRELAWARGVALADDVVDATMGFVDRQPAEGTTSLHRDVAAGRPSEIDAWTGAVVRLASAAGVAAPVHGVLHELLGLRAERGAG
jgi:2-dehydropantoate 2-reductase